MNLKDIQMKLYDRLKESGWSNKLKMYLLSQDFLNLLQVLYDDAQDGKRFTPVLKNLFRAFEECPYGDLKVVVVGQDPYIKADVADGIGLSCSNKETRLESTLEYFLKEITQTLDLNSGDHPWDPDLRRLSNQGVLMLNTALTTEVGKIGAHRDLWEPFMAFLFEVLAESNTGLIYIFMGDKAKGWHTRVAKNNYKFFTSHPISGKYSKEKRWDSGDLFNNVNTLLDGLYGRIIIWW